MASREDVYSKFGITAEAAQLLETALGTALLAVEGLKGGWHLLPKPEEAWAVLNRVEKSALGSLLREIQRHVTFEGDLPAFFRAALKTRNRLIHGFYERHDFKIQTDEGRDEMLADLETMHTELFNAWQVAEAISSFLIAMVQKQRSGIQSTGEAELAVQEQVSQAVEDGIVMQAIRAALISGGVKPKALKRCVAHIRSNMALEVTKDGDQGFRIEVLGPKGRVPLRTAVADWLPSEEAKLLTDDTQ